MVLVEDMVGKAQPRVEAASLQWYENKQNQKLTASRTSMYVQLFIFTVDLLYYCFDYPFCSGNAGLGDKNHLGNIQLFGLLWRLMGELALLGLILPPEVY